MTRQERKILTYAVVFTLALWFAGSVGRTKVNDPLDEYRYP